MAKTYIKLFKNDKKEERDTKHVYQKNNVRVKNKVTLDPDRVYSTAIWKNDDGTLNLKIELKDEELNQSYDI